MSGEAVRETWSIVYDVEVEGEFVRQHTYVKDHPQFWVAERRAEGKRVNLVSWDRARMTDG